MSGDGSLARLAAMVCKQGVMLGGLTDEDRRLALALVWRGLPDGALNERAVNEALTQQLAGAAAFLDTDHVELRRWLVDVGFLVRDGFGREYHRVAAGALPAPSRPMAEVLAAVAEPEAWCEARRAAVAEARALRHRAWLARQAA